MAFRIEFFVKNIAESVRFYQQVLNLDLLQKGEDSACFTNEGSYLLLTSFYILDETHYFKNNGFSKMGGGMEFIITTDEIEQLYERVKQKEPHCIESDLKKQIWGMLDFRVIDPDGYYIRVSSKKQ